MSIGVVYKGFTYTSVIDLFRKLGREKDYNRFMLWKSKYYLKNSWSTNEFIERFLENRIDEKIEYHGKKYPSVDAVLKSIDSKLTSAAFCNWRHLNKNIKFSTMEEAIDYYVDNVKHLYGKNGYEFEVDGKKYDSIVKFFKLNTISSDSSCFRDWCKNNNKKITKDNIGDLISEYMKIYKPKGHKLANH